MFENELRLAPGRSGGSQPAGLRSIVEALFRQRSKLFIVMAAVFMVTLLYTFGAGKRFASEMVLLVQNARLNETVTAGDGSYAPAINDVSDEQLNSEVAVLQSDDVIDEVVDPGWNDRPAASRSRKETLAHEQAVAKMRSRLDVSIIRSSHAISIKYQGSSPERSRNALTRMLQAFLQKQREVGRLPGASKVFTQKAAQYEKDLDAAKVDLASYQNKNGFVTLDGREASLETKLQDLQAASRDADVQISEFQQRVRADREQLAATPQRMSTLERMTPPTGTLDQLNVMLVNLKNKRTELLTKYKPTDRLVQDVENQIATTTAALHQTTATHEVSSDIDPLWQASRHDLSSSEVSLTGLQARRASLGLQIKSLQTELNGIEQKSGEYDALQRRVADLESGYKAYVQKRDNALVSDLMDEQKWLNVAVVQYPTLSLIPSRPRPITDIPIGALTALLLGGCAVFAFEAMRQQVSTPAELELVSRYPVLATVPYDSHADSGQPAYDKSPEIISRAPVEPGAKVAIRSTVSGSVGAKVMSITGYSENFEQTSVVTMSAYDTLVYSIFPPHRAGAPSNSVVVAFTSVNSGEGVSHVVDSLLHATRGSAGDALKVDMDWLKRQPARASLTSPVNVPGRPGWMCGWEHRMQLIQLLRMRSRYTVIDCPAIAGSSDCISLAPLVDGIVLVVEADKTRKSQIRNAESRIEAAGGKNTRRCS